MSDEKKEVNAEVASRRLEIAEALRNFAEQVEGGSIRSLALVTVNTQGHDSRTLHVEQGASSPELFGLGVLITKAIEQGMQQAG